MTYLRALTELTIFWVLWSESSFLLNPFTILPSHFYLFIHNFWLKHRRVCAGNPPAYPNRVFWLTGTENCGHIGVWAWIRAVIPLKKQIQLLRSFFGINMLQGYGSQWTWLLRCRFSSYTESSPANCTTVGYSASSTCFGFGGWDASVNYLQDWRKTYALPTSSRD